MKFFLKLIAIGIVVAACSHLPEISERITHIETELQLLTSSSSNPSSCGLQEDIDQIKRRLQIGERMVPSSSSIRTPPVINKKYRVTIDPYPGIPTSFVGTFKGEVIDEFHHNKEPIHFDDFFYYQNRSDYEVFVPLQKPAEMSESEFAKVKAETSDKLILKVKNIEEL